MPRRGASSVAGHPAAERRDRWRLEHHVPEPWVGHIERAPLLFLSTNPSLAGHRPRHARPEAPVVPFQRAETFKAEHPAVARGLQNPRPAWSDEELIDRFTHAFDVWMPDGVRQIGQNGALGTPVAFWRDVSKLAASFFGRAVIPGIDYALTEVVHCKSTNEVGVPTASPECARRYLRRVLALSPSAVIVSAPTLETLSGQSSHIRIPALSPRRWRSRA